MKNAKGQAYCPVLLDTARRAVQLLETLRSLNVPLLFPQIDQTVKELKSNVVDSVMRPSVFEEGTEDV